MPGAVILDERLRIPVEAHDLASFRLWALSPAFPEEGRIDYLAGDVEVDRSPEDLHTHGRAKVAIGRAFEEIVGDADLGDVFVDRTRISSPAGELSAEPDVVVVLWSSLEAGRVRYVPAASGKPGRYREIEGAPDLVVEIVSDSSVGKDTERLPVRYAAAGVPELWIVDARGEEVRFEILRLDSGAYRPVPADAAGRIGSAVLGRRFRLLRRETRMRTWRYVLEHRTPDA